MNFKRLETFVWVATLGSFRKAAERQYTTQPAISSRIQALEEELGVKLFERDGGPGPVALTAKRKELLPYAEKLIFMATHSRGKVLRSKLLIPGAEIGPIRKARSRECSSRAARRVLVTSTVISTSSSGNS